MGNPFGISLPPLSPPEALALDAKPAHLKRWVSTLNLQDLGQSTRQVYERLRLTNRANISPQARFEWVESLREPLQIITAGLRKHYQNKPFPLPEKAMAIAQLVNALHSEMIHAYRRILSTPSDTSLLGRNSDRQMRQIASYRLFAHAGEILCNYPLMYSPVPHGMWRHLHAYYRRIRAQGWAGAPIPGSAALATIDHLYRKALLLALVPSQLVPAREWEKIKENIDGWVALSSLVEARDRLAERAYYCVRFELDAPQAAATDKCCSACDNAVSGLLLDTAPLIAALEQHLSSRGSAGRSAAQTAWPAPETIEMLLRAWRIPEAPREPRTPVDLPLTIVIGMDNIHAILDTEVRSGTPSAPEEITPKKTSSVPELSLADTAHKPVFSVSPEFSFLGQRDPQKDVWKLSYGAEHFEEAKPAVWNTTPAERRVEPQTARAVDASATGYRLEMDLSEKSSLRLGELIALRSGSVEGWELFLLRWVRRIDEERAALGLERIGDGLRAIEVIVRSNNNSARAALRAVVALDEEMTPLLLMPTLPSLANKRLAIHYADTETAITLGENLALSPLFESYVYSANGAMAERMAWMQESEKKERAKGTGESEPFDEIWRLL